MKKNQQTIGESLNKIKFMINYDASKTRIENIDTLTDNEELSILNEQEDLPTVDTENTECPNSIPYDEVITKMKKVAKMVRRMNTVVIGMTGGGSQDRAKFIFRTIKSFEGYNSYNADFGECKPAIQVGKEFFNEYFLDWFSKGESFEEELQQLLNDDHYTTNPIVQKYLKATLELLKPPKPAPTTPTEPAPTTPTEPAPTTPISQAGGGYKHVEGTNEDPYKLGTSGQGIFKVQECLGITADGKFGPITQSKLLELARSYRHAFTNDDITDICKMASPRRDPSIAPINAIGTDYKPQPNSPLKMTPLASPTNKTTLAPGPKVTAPPKAPVPEKKGFLGGLFKGKK